MTLLKLYKHIPIKKGGKWKDDKDATKYPLS